ncbi:MAG: hypothetical protein N2C14_16155 [Planctomycetales bacterium]
MSIILVCPQCGKKYGVADNLVGKTVVCACGTQFVVESKPELTPLPPQGAAIPLTPLDPAPTPAEDPFAQSVSLAPGDDPFAQSVTPAPGQDPFAQPARPPVDNDPPPLTPLAPESSPALAGGPPPLTPLGPKSSAAPGADDNTLSLQPLSPEASDGGELSPLQPLPETPTSSNDSFTSDAFASVESTPSKDSASPPSKASSLASSLAGAKTAITKESLKEARDEVQEKLTHWARKKPLEAAVGVVGVVNLLFSVIFPCFFLPFGVVGITISYNYHKKRKKRKKKKQDDYGSGHDGEGMFEVAGVGGAIAVMGGFANLLWLVQDIAKDEGTNTIFVLGGIACFVTTLITVCVYGFYQHVGKRRFFCWGYLCLAALVDVPALLFFFYFLLPWYLRSLVGYR